MKTPKKLKATDPNIIAKATLDALLEEKDPLAVALGKRSGLKGGHSRVAKRTPEEIKASSQKAIQARWGKK